MFADQPAVGAAGASPCSHCEQLWQRTLAALQTTLPAEHFETVRRTVRDIWNADPGLSDAPRMHNTEEQFELVLSHDCAAVACTDPNCALCCNSTSRRCSDLLVPKYLVRDPLVPACGAPAVIKIKRRGASSETDEALSQNEFKHLPEFILQVCVLPLGYYMKNKASIPWASIQECCTITAQADGSRHKESVLHCKETTGALEDDGFVSFPHALDSGRGVTYAQISQPGGLRIPEVFFAKRSGESLLDGKQPQIVLAVRAVTMAGVPLGNVQPVASNPFCVATRRVKGAMKVDIPSMDQEVRVLIHIGDACIRKLHELHMHVDKSKNGMIVVPEGCEEVRTVEQMAVLVAANRNSHMGEKRLYQGILNMNEEKWRELQKQLGKAVKPDSMLRVFYCGTFTHPPIPNVLEGPVDVGIIFKCTRGTVELHESGITGVVMRSPGSNVEAYIRRELLSQEPHLLPQLYTHARDAWLLPAHPGWGVFKFQGAPCADLPRAFRDSEDSEQAGLFTYACDPTLIPPFTPSSAAEEKTNTNIRARETATGTPADVAADVATGVPAENVDKMRTDPPSPPPSSGEGGLITSTEMNARAIADADIFSMSSPVKTPENHIDLFHLSTDPLVPMGTNGAMQGARASVQYAHDAQMHAPHAFASTSEYAPVGSGANVGASVFDSVSLKGLSGVTNLSSLFASAVSLPADDARNNQTNSAPSPAVINWMATTSNARNMGVDVALEPANVFSNTMHEGHASGAGNSENVGGNHAPHAPVNTAFATTADEQGGTEGGKRGVNNLRRPRSNTLGSTMLDVARSDRQRLRPDADDQMNACPAGIDSENEKRQGDGNGSGRVAIDMDNNSSGGMSFLNSNMPPSSFSKLFSGGLSIDLNHPDMSLNSNLFNSRAVNGSALFPGILSHELNPSDPSHGQGAPSMSLLSNSIQPGLTPAAPTAAAVGGNSAQDASRSTAVDENNQMGLAAVDLGGMEGI